MKEIEKPTCFLRSVVDSAELKYISENAIYIDKVLIRSNTLNDLVLLIHREVEIPEQIPFKYHVMHGEFHKGHDTLRSWFDHADSFLEFCAENYSAVSMINNITFDHKKELQFQHRKLEKATKRYDTLVKLCDYDFTNSSVPERVIIYGVGYIGRYFYKKVKEKCEVGCFVDRKEKGKEIDEISVLGLEEVDYDRRAVFIITAIQSFEKINEEIKAQYHTAAVISLDDILL